MRLLTSVPGKVTGVGQSASEAKNQFQSDYFVDLTYRLCPGYNRFRIERDELHMEASMNVH